ncbi:hypothetical protein Ciccas_014219 [Cichlidogyrus casuarinus]|uniref:Uncharacterized protein n=1 Tax=Cichlidogyrus casuarinus TaxID=1844966 RepID=A0ABD2PJN6_9PLAT
MLSCSSSQQSQAFAHAHSYGFHESNSFSNITNLSLRDSNLQTGADMNAAHFNMSQQRHTSVPNASWFQTSSQHNHPPPPLIPA